MGGCMEYNSGMNIEWWMLDGAIGLILLASVIRGAARGIGDTLLRLLGMAGGFGLCYLYLGKVADYLSVSPVQKTIHDHMYLIIRNNVLGGSAEQVPGTGDSSEEIIGRFVGNTPADPYAEAMPKTLGGVVNDLADKTANAAASRLTDICINILSILVIVLAVWLVMTIIRRIYRSAKKGSGLIRLSDRILGMAFGVVRGLILSFLAASALIPAVTFFAPDRVSEVLAALEQTRIASILYDINPVMLLVQHFML